MNRENEYPENLKIEFKKRAKRTANRQQTASNRHFSQKFEEMLRFPLRILKIQNDIEYSNWCKLF